MSIPRCKSAHVVLSGRLFVIGGSDEDVSRLRSVEYYEPLIDKWQTVAPMLHKRIMLAASTLNGFIYVIGGEGEGGHLQSIERYNPSEN